MISLLSKKTGVVIGFHGMQNTGDDLFLRIITDWASQFLGIREFYVTAETDKLPLLSESIIVKGIFPKRKMFPRENLLRQMVAALKSNYVIFGAGSIFTINSFRLLYYSMYLLRRLNKRVKILAVGVSIGPFHSNSDKLYCIKLLQLFDIIMVRDEESVDILKAMGIETKIIASFDLALSLPEFMDIPVKSSEPLTIGVSMNNYNSYFGPQYAYLDKIRNDKVVEVISAFISKFPDTQIVLFEICGDSFYGDGPVCKYLLERIAKKSNYIRTVSYSRDSTNVLFEMSRCTVVFAMRMHAGILASMIGIPVVQLSYARKISDFYDTIGLDSEFVHDYNEFNVSVVTEQLVRIIDELQNVVTLKDCLPILTQQLIKDFVTAASEVSG